MYARTLVVVVAGARTVGVKVTETKERVEPTGRREVLRGGLVDGLGVREGGGGGGYHCMADRVFGAGRALRAYFLGGGLVRGWDKNGLRRGETTGRTVDSSR